jgi:adenine-specific DNA-methyltransferase
MWKMKMVSELKIEDGVAGGFEYRKAPHVTLGSITNNEPPAAEILFDQPMTEGGKIRVTGPFTVEAVPCLRIRPFDHSEVTNFSDNAIARVGETANYSHWCDELKVTGIRATAGNILQFSRIEPLSGTRWLHAEGEILDSVGKTQKAFISFGPDFGPLEQRQVEQAVNEAMAMEEKPNFLIFAAFHFDPEAAKDIDQMRFAAGSITILKAQMSVDLLTEDLRKKRSSNQSFWLIGQPDIEVIPEKDGMIKIRVNGFDYYNPITGEIDSGGANKIAMWLLDTDYDEQSLLPDQVFFPMQDPNRDWTELIQTLNGAVNGDLVESFTGIESLPFSPGSNRKIAVKIVDDRGIESFVVKAL